MNEHSFNATNLSELPSKLLRSQALIDGRWVDANDGKRILVSDPATGETVGVVPSLGVAETKLAIDAAERAFATWRNVSAYARSAILRRWFELIHEHMDDLASILSSEQGKPLQEARDEIALGARYVEWYAEEAKRAYGDSIPSPWPAKRLLVFPQPVGVCAAITPWNFPMSMVTRKVAPALAAGCTVVLKPAEETPLSALALAVLAMEAGLPAGVLNVLTGDPETIGRELSSNRKVRKLSFTGSTEIGRLLMAQSAPTLKKLSLELGGNAPFIVFEDADLPAAIDGLITAKFRNMGQTCISPNRIFVHERVHDAFAAGLVERVRTMKIGAAKDPTFGYGPLISAAALSKVEDHVADALGKGARVLTGGNRLGSIGFFYQPAVLVDVDVSMRLFTEETFGPVAPIILFRTDDEVVKLANDSEYGLAAYFYSRDLARIFKVGEALECGMVGVNTGFLTTEVAPFGGIKQSGMGREGGWQGMAEFMVTKYMCLDIAGGAA